MNQQQPLLTGLIPPMITPLTPSGDVDPVGVERMVLFLLDSGVSGIFILGSTGEGPWLTPGQSRQVIDQTVQLVGGRVPVLAGVLEPGTRRTVEAVKQAVDRGADAVVVTTPYYLEADANAQRYHIETVTRAAQVPVVLYNIPSKTHNVLTPEIVGEFVDHDNVIGVKDSSEDWAAFQALLALKQVRPDFAVLQGAEKLAARSVLAGADGVVAGMGNLAPRLYAAMLDCAKTGDESAALAFQERIDALGQLYAQGYWLACLKYAVSLSGLCSDTTSGYADSLSEAAKATIRQLVEKYVT